ncbi:MAG TPA: monovalent cation/H+ antiporter subunit D family protein [Firmicutes bacterium]|jgi:multicomponent Na+:H+ antiporter subunit D|nr:monovalent cation/H+ antiporter subunit D family protein [Bacillota bacterium]
MPFLLIIFSVLCAFISPVFARWKREYSPYLAIFSVTVSFLNSCVLAYRVFCGGIIYYHVADWSPPWGIEIVIDELSAAMLLLLSGCCLLITFYSIRALPKEIPEHATGWYYTVLLLTLTSMMGMVITNDIFNFYVMVEVTQIGACGLVAVRGGKHSTEATLRYLMLASLGSGFILFGIGFLYQVTGNLNISYIAAELAAVRQQYPFLIWATMSFITVGLGVKAALFPLHIWLPDAYSSAPSPSSAILSGLVGKVYIVSMIRIYMLVFGFQVFHDTYMRYLIMLMAAAAILFGSFFAFVQLDLKRRLAYSSVAQVGYIFLGFSLGTTWGMKAAFLHIITHAFMKICLFLSAGAVYYQTERTKVIQFSGLGYQMPVTMAAFTVSAFSMVGIPLFGGFITKYGLAMGSLEAGNPYFIILIVISGLLNASYFFPIIWQSYFTSEHNTKLVMDRVPLSMLVPIVIMALGVIYMGLFPGGPLSFLERTVNRFLL